MNLYGLAREASGGPKSRTLVAEPPLPLQVVPCTGPKEVNTSPRLLREPYFCEGVALRDATDNESDRRPRGPVPLSKFAPDCAARPVFAPRRNNLLFSTLFYLEHL